MNEPLRLQRLAVVAKDGNLLQPDQATMARTLNNLIEHVEALEEEVRYHSLAVAEYQGKKNVIDLDEEQE